MKKRTSPLFSAMLGGSISLAFTLSAQAQATDYIWTQNSVATQDWTTPGNWDATNGVFDTGSENTLTFFSDITTPLANGTNAITGNVPTALTMRALTLNGKGAAATAPAVINIASSASTWTLDGTTPQINLNGVNGTQPLSYTFAAKIALAQADTLFTGNGTAGFTFSGIISGSGNAITKSGSSNLTLTGANTYSGGTTLSAGTITIGTSNTALGGGAFSVTGNATLATAQNLGARTLANTVSVSATKTLTLNAGYANMTFTNAITNSGTIATGGGGNNFTAGYILLSGTNADSGKFIIGDGSGTSHGHTIQFAKTASLYSGNTTSWTAANILVKNGGALSLNVGGTNEFTTGDVTTLLTNLGGANGSSTAGFAPGSAIGFDTTNASGGTFTVADNITNSGTGGGSVGLIKYGTKTLELTGANTYTGPTMVVGGNTAANKLLVSGTGAIKGGGTLQVGVGANPGRFEYTSSATDTLFSTITLGGGSNGGTATLVQSAGTITATTLRSATGRTSGNTGNIDISAGTLRITGTATIGEQDLATTPSTVTISGTGLFQVDTGLKVGIAQTDTRDGNGIIAQNGGTVTVAGGLTLAGTAAAPSIRTAVYNLNGGELNVNAISMATSGAGTNTSTFNFNGGTLKPTASSLTFMQGLTTANVKNGGAKIDTAGFDVTIAQPLLHFTGATTDSLTKDGLGTLTLTGANNYSGATTVNSGTLKLGTINPNNETSTVTVVSGAKIDIAFTGNDTVGALILGGTNVPAGSYNSSHPTYGSYFLATDTGSIVVVPALTGYAAWLLANGAGVQTIDQDHDSDGVDNGVEYFMGESGNGFTTTPGIVSNAITWPMAATYSGTYGTHYVVQTSPDLTTWTPATVGAGPGFVAITPGVSVIYTMPAPAGKLFVRLLVNPN